MAGFSAKDKKGNSSVHVEMISGIGAIPKNTPVTLTLNGDTLEIKQRFFGKEPFSLACAQITDAGMISSEEIVERNKSVIGRAAVGGLLLGPLGAIVGGMSGTGKKQKTERHVYFVINYTSGKSGESQVLSFQDAAGNLPGVMKAFTAELRAKASLQDQEQTEASHTL
jgi:hypothetical protein